MNANKTKFMCCKQERTISFLRPVHLLWQQYLINWKWCQYISSIGIDYYWQVMNKIEIWSLQQNKIGFLPSCDCVNMTVCTTWNFRKHIKKKINENYKRILHGVLNKSWKQHPTSMATHLPSKMNKACRETVK